MCCTVAYQICLPLSMNRVKANIVQLCTNTIGTPRRNARSVREAAFDMNFQCFNNPRGYRIHFIFSFISCQSLHLLNRLGWICVDVVVATTEAAAKYIKSTAVTKNDGLEQSKRKVNHCNAI